jgi:hypothetical protein
MGRDHWTGVAVTGARSVFVAALAAWLVGPAGAAFAAPASYTVVPIAAPGVCVTQVNGINANGMWLVRRISRICRRTRIICLRSRGTRGC